MNRQRVLICFFFMIMVCFFGSVDFVQAAPDDERLRQAHAFEHDSGEEDRTSLHHRYTEQQLEQLGGHEVEQFWQQIRDEYDGFLPDSQPAKLIDIVKVEGSLFSLQLVKGFLQFAFHEFLLNMKLLGTIILLAVFSMILQQIQTAFEKNNVSKVAYAIVYLVLFILAINSFYVAVEYAREAISSMVHFMIALIPLILALLASTGSLTSVALFHPFIIFLVNASGVIIHSIVFPLLFLSALLSIVSTFSEQYKVTQLANLLRNISIGVLGVFLTIFLGVVSVQGATSAVVDGVTIRTAKFVTGNFVPVVGRMFTDATDTVIGASLLVKNTIGLAGVIIVVLVCAFPALKILLIAFIFHFSSAILQPLGQSRITECLNIIGKNIMLVFAALVTLCLMFFLVITIIVTAGNLSIMIR